MPAEPITETPELPEARAASAPASELEVTGMTCSNCGRHVSKAILGVPGVSNATVDVESGRASVRWAADSAANSAAVVHAVEEAGYGARLIESHSHEHGEPGGSGWRFTVFIGVAGMV